MKPKPKQTNNQTRRAFVRQNAFPNLTLEKALEVPKALWENYAGKPTTPLDLALALSIKPTTGSFRNLCGAATAYGLTEGGYASKEISMTALAREIVAPTEEGAAETSRIQALLKPEIQGKFYKKYENAQFPKDNIAENVLITMGIPKERATKALEILKKNGKENGIIVTINGSPFVKLKGVELHQPSEIQKEEVLEPSEKISDENISEEFIPEQIETSGVSKTIKGVEQVFITHGKNEKILKQLEKIVGFGGFEVLISKEHHTSAKPVPEKVLKDMQSCQAAVIHVGVENTFVDDKGETHQILNGNVLIEIGAALALYDKKFILLVEEGIKLPSNLQGLYECRYTGNELNTDATMKLLEAFNDFKKGA